MSTEAYRYAQAMAVTERARGRAEEERAWLDLLAMLDAPAPAPAPSVVPEAAVEESADWTYPTATDMTLGDFRSAGLAVPGMLVELHDKRGSRTVLIGHTNDLLGLCDDCPENRRAQVVRYRRIWSPEAATEGPSSE